MSDNAKAYTHTSVRMTSRPEIGAAPRFKSTKQNKNYRFDSSVSPTLEWDNNSSREAAEFLIACIEDAANISAPHMFAEPRKMLGADGSILLEVAGLHDALGRLKRMQRHFLNWSGKAEHPTIDVPTLPLFVHERLSTQAIIKTLEGHRRDPEQAEMFSLFADPQRPMAEQVRAFEHKDHWVNRMILGDSLIVMNSLISYEGIGGQVQMIYMDPPYGVKFASNFQPFVRKKDVGTDDSDMTREPEMVQAYRDTWALGIHSYLTYIRDRLLISHVLLKDTGSIFVQIGDENLHHVRELLDEVFGPENFIAVIPFRKKTMPLGAKHLEGVCDYILFYAKNKDRVKYRPLLERMTVEGDNHWNYVELPDGSRRKMSREEVNNHSLLPNDSTPIQLISLYPAGVNDSGLFPFEFRGKTYTPPKGNSWFTNKSGMERLAAANRLEPYEDGKTLRYVLKLSDSPFSTLTNMWADTSAPSDKRYVVQTNTKVVQRCMLMTTDPGDLVLDPTCGSGTTAFVAEYWGRRWITIDTSRVPLALARQRILSATFPWFILKDDNVGPASGFQYSRRRNRRGAEVGGLIPYITKGSIASNEKEEETIVVHNPDRNEAITRISGPFVVEAALPPAQEISTSQPDILDANTKDSHISRMIEVLRKSPNLTLSGNKKVILKNIRRPAKTLSLSAEALMEIPSNDAEKSCDVTDIPPQILVSILFGPENGPVSAKAILDAAKESNVKGYAHLFVVGFSITPEARREIEGGEEALGLPASWITATMDLQMGDLLKNQRSSQIFAVCGLPDIQTKKLPPDPGRKIPRWQVTLVGLDVFDPTNMETDHIDGDNVPAWMLDTNWSGMVFHADQVFFPRTSSWDNLRKALGTSHDDSVWSHLAGDKSAPFEAEPGAEIAVKVIDDRGNELIVSKRLGG